MLKSLMAVWKKIPFRKLVYAALVINLLTAVLIIAIRSLLPPVVPLLYGLPAGAQQLVKTPFLLIVPLIAQLITLGNILLTLTTKDIFFKKTLVVTSIFISILSTITIVKIILLIGFF